MSATVSIIIPCHNAAPWLAATIDSALSQTWEETEILVIDDGSTDDSLAIARRRAKGNMRVLSQRNAGASAARNHGLRLARGEYIQFLDADDLLSPMKIAAQISLFVDRAPGCIASCAWGRFTDDPGIAAFVDQAVFRDFSPVDFMALAGRTGAMMHPSAWLVPRAIIDRAGPWDESLSLNDDGEFFSRVLLASAGVAFCAKDYCRSYYRSALPESLSQQRTERARRSAFRATELIVDQMLRAENSERTRAAAAAMYHRFIHDFFPFPAELMALAEQRSRVFGATAVPRPAMGLRTATLAAVLGWRNVWRLKHWLDR